MAEVYATAIGDFIGCRENFTNYSITEDDYRYLVMDAGTKYKATCICKVENTANVIEISFYGSSSSVGKIYFYAYSNKYISNLYITTDGSYSKIDLDKEYIINESTLFYAESADQSTDFYVKDVHFCKPDGSLYGSMQTTSETISWTKYTLFNRGVPVDINLSEHVWQHYQSSAYILKNSTDVQKLKNSANVFYEVIEPEHDSEDPMRIIIVSAELGALDFGEIKTITDTYDASLSVIPVVPFGFSRSFCMDLGIFREITIQYQRAMPEFYNDNSSDSREWSNMKWQTQLKKFEDRWQMRTNGVRLYLFRPGKRSFPLADEDIDMRACYPPINPNPILDMNNENWINAYMTHCNNNYSNSSTNMISGSVTFLAGTIYPKSVPEPMAKVTLKRKDGEKIEEIFVPLYSFSALPDYPSSFRTGGFVCTRWVYKNLEDAGKETSGHPGDIYLTSDEETEKTSEGLVLTADGYEPGPGPEPIEKVFCYNDGKVETYEAKMNHRYAIMGVGAGGGGAPDRYWVEWHVVIPDPHWDGGGGGGSGGTFRVPDLRVTEENLHFEIVVGKGGSGRNAGEELDGENGGGTSIKLVRQDGSAVDAWSAGGGYGAKYNNTEKGGDGGHRGVNGRDGAAGGHGGRIRDGGGDGGVPEGGWADFRGRGGRGEPQGGGGGGGAVAYDEIFSTTSLLSRGGHGARAKDADSSAGVNGGGGGGGANGQGSSSGGHGYARIVDMGEV